MRLSSFKKPVIGAALLAIGTAASAADIELGLVIDGSSSIGSSNFQTQQSAYAQAVANSSIVAQDSSVALSGYVFSSGVTQLFSSTVVDSQTTADALATNFTNASYPLGGTNIGAGITAAANEIFGNGIDSDSQVIDVSTDGGNNRGDLSQAISDALGAGIDGINCLGISDSSDCSFVDGGVGFSETVAGFDDLQDTLERKLSFETGGGGNFGQDVPEPGSLSLLALAILGVGGTLRLRARRQG